MTQINLAPPTFSNSNRPLSAISTATTIRERSPIPISNPSTDTHHHLSLLPTDDYETRLKLIDENRAKLVGSPLPISIDSNIIPLPLEQDKPLDNQVVLEFLLASSSRPSSLRLILNFQTRSKVEEVKDGIRSNWPTDWSEEESVPKRADQIRLLFLGRFLNDWESLDSLRLAKGSPTIMHLVVKSIDSEPRSSKNGRRTKSDCCSSETTRVTCCTIF
ncbi:hypothetical protein CROQUDRAFT_67926 [Cronartium quercuum f. sp. fusiforme G11]|uniref:Ubiquitin-like domain-containing protein n=1 Tax=Cronartium quercuum f. sp. fusiforme G11 TaxID=708437 RepID=A0A9P6NA52_9BASI|nr:hypothetical protein CROQUDRAFT_67926 [Cronartium quercuum f. sp. fusiforme G11]